MYSFQVLQILESWLREFDWTRIEWILMIDIDFILLILTILIICISTSLLLNNIPNVEVSDTTTVDSSTTAGDKKILQHKDVQK